MGLPQFKDRFVEVSGSSIRYWVKGQGRVLILVHGLACSVEFWQYNVGPLAGDCQVYAMDLPGSGLSDKQLTDFSLEYGASFLRRFMDTLGIQSAILVGHSTGGVLCAQLAVQFPKAAQALILVDSAGFGRELHWFLRLWSLPLLGDLLFRAYQAAFPALKSWVFCNGSSVSDEWVQGAAAKLREEGVREVALKIARKGANLYGQREELVHDLHLALGSLSIPTLIIWGDRDAAVPVSHAEHARQLIPDSEVRVMPGRGHLPQVERPGDFNALVLSFLASNPP